MKFTIFLVCVGLGAGALTWWMIAQQDKKTP